VKRVFRIGKYTPSWRKRPADIFIKAEVKEGELTISGVIGPLPSGNAVGGCGQINMEFAHRDPDDNDKRYDYPIQPEAITFAPGWDREKWLDLLDIWERWHLNLFHEEALPPEVETFIAGLPLADKQPVWV